MRIFPLFMGCLSLLAAAAAAAESAPADVIELTFDSDGFHPDRVTAPAGERVYFHVRNAVAQPFNFEIEELNLSRQIKPGADKTIYTLSAPEAGTYRFIAEFQGVDEDKSPGGQLEVK